MKVIVLVRYMPSRHRGMGKARALPDYSGISTFRYHVLSTEAARKYPCLADLEVTRVFGNIGEQPGNSAAFCLQNHSRIHSILPLLYLRSFYDVIAFNTIMPTAN